MGLFNWGASKSDTIYFFHIAKTAGTTLTSYLDEQFANEDIMPAKRWEEAYDVFTQDDLQLGAHPFDKYKLIRGHFYYGIYHQLSAKPRYLTMLRDPVEHTISSFNHLMNDYEQNPKHVHEVINKNDTLKSVYKNPKKSAFYTDQQVRVLAQDIDMLKMTVNQFGTELKGHTTEELNIGTNKVDHSDLVVATKHLDSFEFVGITELFQESLLVLADKFEWTPKRDDSQLMVNKGRPETSSLDEDLIETIEKHHQLDYLIYEEARKLLLNDYKKLVKKRLKTKLSHKELLQKRAEINDKLFETWEM